MLKTQHQLLTVMADRIVSGLQRKSSLTRPSRWACACRMMGEPFAGKWTFKYHPWLLEMHDSVHEINIGQKSAQMGYTETVLNLTFFNIDIKGVDCLYVLPAKTPDASDFSAGRFDKALELSPHLANMFSDVKNVGHKRAGTANMYIRGSRSRSGLKSIPVGFCVLDEVDEMDQDNIPLALERVSGQREWMAWLLSTPTVPDVGINKHFNQSTQDHFHFKCPKCTKWTELLFPDCIQINGEDARDPEVETSYLKCKECQGRLEHEEKPEFLFGGKWISSFSNRHSRGFYINQLYSATVTPSKIAKAYFLAQHDPSEETEFYNSKLGLPHTVSGAQLTDADINKCLNAYENGRPRPNGIVTIGIDVGKWLHYEVDEWHLMEVQGDDLNTNARCRVLEIGKAVNFDELDRLMNKWRPHAGVIDANPERRTALQFANRFYGFIHLCVYGRGINGKEIHVSEEEHTVLVDRTAWLDLSLGRFRRDEAVALPANLPFEYREQLKVLVRVYKKDKDGNAVGYYENFGKDDHYAHARNYAEIALKFAATIAKHKDIRSPV